jgi:hypothetical protein
MLSMTHTPKTTDNPTAASNPSQTNGSTSTDNAPPTSSNDRRRNPTATSRWYR